MQNLTLTSNALKIIVYSYSNCNIFKAFFQRTHEVMLGIAQGFCVLFFLFVMLDFITCV